MKFLNQPSRMFAVAGVVAAGLILDGPPAHAVVTITTCNQAAASDNLILDPAGTAIEITYDHDDPPCVIVKNGNNFDMKGYKIRCVPGVGHSTCQSPAIKCEGTSVANSNIQDTLDGNNDHDSNHVNIEGPASVGVLECGTVQKLKIDGALTGISVSGTNGKLYLKNVISPSEYGTGMDLVLQDNTDRVAHNRIDGGNYGIKIVGKSSTSGPMIDLNVLRAFQVSGIYNNDSTYVRLKDNAILEGGERSVPFLMNTSNATFTDNVCEVGGPCTCELDYLTPEAGVNPPLNCF